MVVLKGDINFDLIGRPDSLLTRYSNTLDMFGQLSKLLRSRLESLGPLEHWLIILLLTTQCTFLPLMSFLPVLRANTILRLPV